MYESFLEFTTVLAKEVGKIHLSYFRGDNLGIDTKSNIYDVVTRADKESEEYIATTVLAKFPDHKVLGEEGGYRGNEYSDYVWVVDPLDGTNNYSQGLPVFCVSIALQYKGETIVGVVYAPYLDELYTASKDGGAFLQSRMQDRKQIAVSQKQDLNVSVLGTGFPYDKDLNPDNNAENLARILPNIRGVRRMGAAAYDICCVASGFLDGYWEQCLQIWDVCAANLILQEAGGVVYYYKENRGISEIVGNEQIVSEIRKYVR